MIFFPFWGEISFSKHDRKVIPSGLQNDSLQIFNIRTLIILWPWASFELRFLIIFKILYVKNLTAESDFHGFRKKPREVFCCYEQDKSLLPKVQNKLCEILETLLSNLDHKFDVITLSQT